MSRLSAAQGLPALDEHSIIDRESRELDLDHLAKVHLITEKYRFNMANYIPLRGLPERDGGKDIARRILKQTVQTVFDRNEYARNNFRRDSNGVSGRMKTTVGVGEQKLHFRLKVFEAVGEIAFTGVIDGRLAYEIDENEFKGELSKYFYGRYYSYCHIRNSETSTDMILVRWTY